MKTSVLIPTRWRPDGFKRLWDSLFETAGDELEILVGADVDDDTDYSVPCIRYDNLGSSEKVHELAKLATGDMMRVFSTDELVKTKNWDTILYSRFPSDKLAVLATTDCIGGHKGGCVPVISKEWYAIAGYYPNLFWHSYGDTWVVDIANKASRFIFVKDVVVEHLKKTQGRGNDRLYSYRAKKDRGRDNKDLRKLWEKSEVTRQELAEKIKALI